MTTLDKVADGIGIVRDIFLIIMLFVWVILLIYLIGLVASIPTIVQNFLGSVPFLS